MKRDLTLIDLISGLGAKANSEKGESLERFNSLINRHHKKNVDPIHKLGQLQTKDEAAGKVRVFAMVDI
jgi:hypothetical protein